MITLTPAELRVVSAARALVELPTGPTASLVRRGHRAPEYLTTDARYLIEEAIAIGWVEVLARAGGWRRRAGRDGTIGRLWDRHGDVEMAFSRFAPALCEWIAVAPLWGQTGELHELGARPETPGDQLLCLLAARLAIEAGCPYALATPALANSWLVQLHYPNVLAREFGAVEPAAIALDDPCTRLILDGIAGSLAARLVYIEHQREALTDLDHCVTLGTLQAQSLGSLYDALEAVDAMELGFFAIGAATEILAAPPNYAARLGPGTIAERARARSACTSFLRSLDRWRRWGDQARSLRFFDDGYERSQRLLALWETLGDRGYARLVAIADELEALAPGGEIQ